MKFSEKKNLLPEKEVVLPEKPESIPNLNNVVAEIPNKFIAIELPQELHEINVLNEVNLL